VVLEHAGGPAIEAGTALTVEDARSIAPAERGGPTVTEEFAEGETAYVY